MYGIFAKNIHLIHFFAFTFVRFNMPDAKFPVRKADGEFDYLAQYMIPRVPGPQWHEMVQPARVSTVS